MEKSPAGTGERDLVLAAGGLDFAGSHGSARFGDVPDTVAAGMVDVVPERQRAIGGEGDLVEAAEPSAAFVRGEVSGRFGQVSRQAQVLVRSEIAFDEADLPVDPFLAPDGRPEDQSANDRVPSQPPGVDLGSGQPRAVDPGLLASTDPQRLPTAQVAHGIGLGEPQDG